MDCNWLLATADTGGHSGVTAWLTFWWNVGLVLLGLNLVILVHELGHFLVAKWCNVQCEKFYVWFDIFGWRIFRFRWGETEYGMGVLPLGGYVKLLGQEDNPARLKEEIERAKRTLPPEELARLGVTQAEAVLYDPRSYFAQSVPRRMAIISAGVAMNVVFAFVAAVGAFLLGVEQQSPTVGVVFPGEAAWRAGMRPGDVIEKVGDRTIARFTDLQRLISVGDVADGVRLTVRRMLPDGAVARLEILVHPDRIRAAPTIGITNGFSTQLHTQQAILSDVPTVLTDQPLRPGDQIVAVDGIPVESYGQIHRIFARWPNRPLRLTVRREDGENSARELEVTIFPRKVRHVGLVFRMGPVVAVQEGSPAQTAGIQSGDEIVAIDDAPVADPLRLPEVLRQKAAAGATTVKVSWKKAAGQEIQTEEIPLTLPEWYDIPVVPGGPASIPALGVAYRVLPEIVDVLPGSPAAETGLRAGRIVREVRIVRPAGQSTGTGSNSSPGRGRTVTISLESQNADWAFVHAIIQDLPAGAKVELVLDDQSTYVLEPIPADEWFYPDRGLVWSAASFVLQAPSLAAAIYLGAEETWNALTFIIRTLQKLGTGQVSPRGLAGPLGIAHIAYYYASEGLATFLIFLCLLSANLAVLNFIPIPVLDGGHMVFLTYEAIRGKPPSESVVAALTFAGLVFLLALMIWATGMDVMRFFGGH